MKKRNKLNRGTVSKEFELHRWNCWPLPFEFLARLLQGHRALAGGGFDLRKFRMMWLEAIMEEKRVEETKRKHPDRLRTSKKKACSPGAAVTISLPKDLNKERGNFSFKGVSSMCPHIVVNRHANCLALFLPPSLFPPVTGARKRDRQAYQVTCVVILWDKLWQKSFASSHPFSLSLGMASARFAPAMIDAVSSSSVAAFFTFNPSAAISFFFLEMYWRYSPSVLPGGMWAKRPAQSADVSKAFLVRPSTLRSILGRRY